MKEVYMFMLFNSVAIICASGAVWLASNGQEGWGWLLVVAVISQATKLKDGDQQ